MTKRKGKAYLFEANVHGNNQYEKRSWKDFCLVVGKKIVKLEEKTHKNNKKFTKLRDRKVKKTKIRI